ncbi:S9 family peptidase [Maribellus maritimus]|uniref:S9 family peptidase n=1 Tax=Maribellus maritimus TaxID=2870838 RepID=UPI001EEA03F2|nr:S9 family peptidase [Maribellus maritimus]MCG6185858.1 S9 family peptidase [Maribellus maritimus]
MKYFTKIIPMLLCLTFFSAAKAQNIAEKFDRYNAFKELTKDKVLHGYFEPHWFEDSPSFWYSVQTEDGEKYYTVLAERKKKTELLDVNKLISELSIISKKSITREEITDIHPSDNLKEFTFVYDQNVWTGLLPSYKLSIKEPYKKPGRPAWSMRRRDLRGNDPVESPDGKWTAFVQDYNVWVQNKETGETTQLSYDGGIGLYYSSFIQWSPDSKKLVSSLYQPAEKHMVNYIESSPEDQIQPKYSSIEYYKPGDALPQSYPCVFDVTRKTMIASCKEMIPNQYNIGRPQWRNNSESLTFEYNKRGHQVYQVIEMNAKTGNCRVLINETQPSFIDYSSKKYRYDVNDGTEIIWASERDGWNHLYLYDGETGKVKNQITKGEWVVRRVEFVDTLNKKIVFAASGKEGGDPYFLYYYSINFDGSGQKLLTPENGNHRVSFSPNHKFMVDSWSKVDVPPTTILRNAETGKEIMPLEKADISQLLATGWKKPEVFSTKGRDGETDIWGVFLKPSDFDASKKYPVIEYIYAGPHGSFVPKDFSVYYNRCRQSLAELGFIVVMIDGMGTSNRSKAFHDVCWKNIKDAGFPDRIIWMKDAAKKYPFMDISKVGIYGKSAGGQNSTAAVLFHPEFYKVAVSVCGCHDNRMDKIWWNEQWMGWPIGPEYSGSSNVDNAYRLQGDLMLVVGEMDKNVDPASTYQVCDALIKANKEFDFLMLPGKGHEWGGEYGERRICNYFINHVMNIKPPKMNSSDFGKRLIKTDIDIDR